MFSIDVAREAEKDLEKLSRQDREQILKKVWSIRENPPHYLERLTGFTLWKLRIGDYRAIIHILTKEQRITVIKVGHRKDVYQKL